MLINETDVEQIDEDEDELLDELMEHMNQTNQAVGMMVGLMNKLLIKIEQLNVSEDIYSMKQSLISLKEFYRENSKTISDRLASQTKVINLLEIESKVKVRAAVSNMEKKADTSWEELVRLTQNISFLNNTINSFLTDTVGHISNKIDGIENFLSANSSVVNRTSELLDRLENMVKKLPLYVWVVNFVLIIVGLFGLTEAFTTFYANKTLDRMKLHNIVTESVSNSIQRAADEYVKREFEKTPLKVEEQENAD